MAYLVTTEDEDVLHATTHGLLTRNDLSFFRERVDTALRSAGGFAREYLSRASDRLMNFDFDRLRDSVEGMRERFGERYDEDRIRSCITLVDFQQAKSTMRPLLMANPRLRTLWYDQRADGYAGLYEDDDVGAVGRRHYTYRTIMNGSYVENEEGGDSFVTYLGVVDEHGDQPLNKRAKDIVRASWCEQNAILDRGKQDPSSPTRKTL